jgi:hypothetical protein
VLVALAALAWLAWHPQAFSTPFLAPLLVTKQTHALAPGVTLRLAATPSGAWTVADFSVDLARAHLRIGQVPGGGLLSDLVPPDAIAAVNGAFFEKDFTPHGWLVDDGVELHPKKDTSPHHVFAVRGTEAFAGRFETLPFAPTLALQNFPLLVEDGAARIQQTDRDPPFPRTFACDSGGGVVHLVVVLPTQGSGPTLYETAHLAALPVALGGFGCRGAVNLDGGPSSGYWVRPDAKVPFTPPDVPVGHVVAIVPN